MEKFQLVEKDGELCGWIDEIIDSYIRICFFDDNCDLISLKYFKEHFKVLDEFI